MSVLVTGASAGFGRAIAKKFANNGHKVIAVARREEKLESLKDEIKNCQIIACDICNRDELLRGFESLDKDYKDVDILINNAGLALGIAKAQNCEFDDWDRMIEVNIKALSFITHYFLPKMIENKNGHIINIGSIAGTYPYPGGNVYGATKAFVKQFSLNLRADVAGSGVRVSNIEPGLSSDSEFSLVRFKGDSKKVEELYRDSNALKPEDIAESVYFVANMPKHVNINSIELMPTSQSFAALDVYRSK